ncbi:ATP-grasp domain-containing protein [Piscinibacter sp.]|uniref:ATP-grasp domain-containing protein n=1 Tax=Piscinibacter sp. TaxID=1903157 RepID=UPI0039E5E0B8
MRRVFVYEYLSGGGLVDGDAQASAELLPQGLAMRDALVAELLDSGDFAVSAATCERAAAPPAGAVAVTARDGETPLAFATRLAAQHDAALVVAPESDGCLAAFERAIGAPRWRGCDARSIAIASSKTATLRHLAAHGIVTPLAFAHEAQRWVVKPDDGAGSVATRVHANRLAAEADLAGREARGASACLEPWVDGEPASLSLLCGHGGHAELLSVNRQRIAALPDGTLRYDGVEIDVLPRAAPAWQALAALAGRVVAALPGLHGLVGVDFIASAYHGPVVIEVNPRPTCACVGLSARLQRKLAREWLALSPRETSHA